MIDMSNLLNLQGELFLLLAMGFIFRRFVVGEEFQNGLTTVILELILPCNIITSFQMEMSAELFRSSIAIFWISLANQVICALLALFLFRKSRPERVPPLQYGLLCSNAGFLGTPVAEGIWGMEGLLLAAIFLIPQRIAMWTVGVSYFDKGKTDKPILRMLKNRCIDAVLIGIVLMVTQVQLPGFLDSAISAFGKCNTGMSMFLIGMIASRIRMKDFLNPEILYYSFIRLAVIPAITLLVCRLAGADPLSTGISVILVTMPAGGTTAVLAERYKTDPEFAVSMVAASTVLSLVAIPLWGMIL